MSLNYLNFGSYWRNLTSPLTHRHRGTAVQIDTAKDYPDTQVVVGELGTDIVVVTMAARITQSIFTLARNLLHRRPLCWKIIPGDWKSKAFQAVQWICWKIINLLLAAAVTNVRVYKNLSKDSTHCHTEQSMNTICIQCHWGCKAELKENMVPEEEMQSPRMEELQENTYMEEICDHKVLSDLDVLVSKERLLPSCTNPFILSMICVPSEDEESSLPSEESDNSEFESDGESDDHLLPCEVSNLSKCGDEEVEKSSLEDASVDSGLQESWTAKSKEDMDGSEEESEWSDEEDDDDDEEDDDSWNTESDADDGRDDDLWSSFCRTDDPYNPLSFAMPTRSCKQQVKAHQKGVKSCTSTSNQEESQILKCNVWSQAKKPVLSSFKCSHKCASPKDESEALEEINQTGNPGVKKVRFSSNVAVHHMITWNYAYRMARKGPWEECARDRSRFQKRIAETEAAIGFCLDPSHREKIWAARHCKEEN